MRDQQLLPASPEPSREELFLQRYAQLCSWAMRVTGNNRETAEDLVHDAFIQFMLGRTSLEEIENIDGYLRRMLRYMYLSKMNRNSQKFFDQTLSISDYDSFHQTWRAIQPPDRMQAQEELSRICAYACLRKETSRAGSVLILRFFHDYLPTEIARILCSTRHCVDEWQRLARKELKAYLAKPARLGIVNAKTRTQAHPAVTKLSGVNCDVIAELRQIIFSSRQGDCFSPDELWKIYKLEKPDTLSTTRLAHLVSCQECLDRVNEIVGLPSLSERHQPEQDDPDDPSNTTGGSTVGKETRRRLREVKEHKPQELRIAVNGVLLGSLKINCERSEIDLKLAQQQIEYVEIFSEQGLQLIFLTISDSAGLQREQWARLELSEDRSLEVVVSFQTEPTLHLAYLEPAVQTVPDFVPLQIVDNKSLARATATPPKSPFSPLQTLKRLVGAILTLTRKRSKETCELAPDLFSIQRSTVARRSIWTRPGFITAVVSILMICTFAFFKTRIVPVSTESDLLERASIAEERSGRPHDAVIHRQTNFEQRVGGRVVSRKTIESWQQPDRRVRRLFDERNNLIAGIWERDGASTTIYHHGSRLETTAASTLPASVEDVWQIDLSAKEFKELAQQAEEKAHVEETSRSYILTCNKNLKLGALHILQLSITLDRTTLHAAEQTVTIDNAGEIREYRFAETSFEQFPSSSVDPKIFEIDPELLTAPPPAENKNVNSAPEATANTPPSVTASTELEVEVAYLLNQANGEQNEQVTLSRTPDGRLLVEGVVESDERKLKLLRVLDPVRGNSAVRIDLRSVTDTTQRSPARSGTVVLREAEETANTVAVYSDLHSYFSKSVKSSSEDQVDNAVRAFSSKTVNRAYRILFHAIELKRLADRFANVDMRAITPDARAKWLQLTHDHAATIEREMATLREELQPIFPLMDASPAVRDRLDITTDGDLSRAIERLHRMALANNEAIREAFTISSRTSSAALKSAQFWRSLRAGEDLGGSIRRYQ